MAEPTLVDHLLARRRALARPPGLDVRRRDGPTRDADLRGGRATRSAAYAQALRERGVGAGDRVAVMLDNRRSSRSSGSRSPGSVPRSCRSTCATARPTPSTSLDDAGVRARGHLAGVRRPAARPRSRARRRAGRRPGARAATVRAGAGRPRRRSSTCSTPRARPGDPRAACSPTATGRRWAPAMVEEFPHDRRRRRDADRAAVLLPRPAVERRDRADGRRPPGRARRLPPVDLLGRRCAATR